MKQNIVKYFSIFLSLLTVIGMVVGLDIGGLCTSDDSVFVRSEKGVSVEHSRPSSSATWENVFTAGSMIECRAGCHLKKNCKSATFNATENKCMLKNISRVDFNVKISVSPALEYFEKVPLCATTEKMIAMIDKVVDCKDIYNLGWRRTGIYAIPIAGERAYTPVMCEMSLFGGGWTVFQSRVDGTVPFNRDWDSYREGFGEIRGNFWYGNEKIHHLTWTTDNVILFELLWPTRSTGSNGITYYPSYHGFKVDSESNNYALSGLGVFEDMAPSANGDYNSICRRSHVFKYAKST